MRRPVIALGLVGVLLLTGCAAAAPSMTPTASPAAPAWGGQVDDLVASTMSGQHLAAVIMTVTEGGVPVYTKAWGDSVPGTPATVDMHYRTGSVSIAEMATVLLQLVDAGKVSLDDKISAWLPDVPHSDEVTLGELAQMTSGYQDYLWNADFLDKLYSDPLRQWSTDEQLAAFEDEPLLYQPGTNWNYAHSNYVLLGLALEQITGQPLADLLAARVLQPLGLTQTAASDGPEMLQPELHAIDGERRDYLGIPAGTPYYEDSTNWNPGWSLAEGSFQNSTVGDAAAIMRAVGRGDLVSPASHELQVATTLRGKTTPLPGCPTCGTMTDAYTYGYGVVISGGWLVQNPALMGYAAAAGYLPAGDIAISIVATAAPDGLAPDGNVPQSNPGYQLFKQVAAIVAPGSLPSS